MTVSYLSVQTCLVLLPALPHTDLWSQMVRAITANLNCLFKRFRVREKTTCIEIPGGSYIPSSEKK